MSNLKLVTISDIINILSSGSYDANTSASKLFDNNISTLWNSFANDANGNTYVTIELRESAILKSFKIKGISKIADGYNGLRDYRILGSNDNSNFDTIFSASNPNTTGDTLLINVDNDKKYKFYKFEALNSWFSLKRVVFAEIEYHVRYLIKNNLLKSNNKVYSLNSSENLMELPVNSLTNFIKYGTNTVDNFNKIQVGKSYILQDTVSKDTDGLWKQELNRKPLSIKFQ